MLVPTKGDIDSILSEYDELLKVLPSFAKYAVEVYKLVRLKRMRLFLESLSRMEEDLTSKQKKRLRKVLESKEGQRILSDYIDSLLRTSSEISIVAFALLYADVEHERYSLSFKRQASVSLAGITDETVLLFLTIVRSLRTLQKKAQGPYPVYFCDERVIVNSDNEMVRSYFASPELLVSGVQELIQRRLLVPDYAQARFGLSSESVDVSFGFGKISEQFADLLTRAEALRLQIF